MAAARPPGSTRGGHAPVWAKAINTGVLCGELRPLDLDIDRPKSPPPSSHWPRRCSASPSSGIAKAAHASSCSIAPRPRTQTARRWILRPARSWSGWGADGPRSRRWGGASSSLPTGAALGAELEWTTVGPEDVPVANLVAITEAQLTSFLDASQAIIGPAPKKPKSNGHDTAPYHHHAPDPPLPACSAASMACAARSWTRSAPWWTARADELLKKATLGGYIARPRWSEAELLKGAMALLQVRT